MVSHTHPHTSRMAYASACNEPLPPGTEFVAHTPMCNEPCPLGPSSWCIHLCNVTNSARVHLEKNTQTLREAAWIQRLRASLCSLRACLCSLRASLCSLRACLCYLRASLCSPVIVPHHVRVFRFRILRALKARV